jgi:hypothetical protein
MGTTPTIWCTIQRVQPLPPWRRAGVKLTVVDRKGTVVTIALATSDLNAYASFQVAVLRATGHPFHYLPGTIPQVLPGGQARMAGSDLWVQASRHTAQADDGATRLEVHGQKGARGLQCRVSGMTRAERRVRRCAS